MIIGQDFYHGRSRFSEEVETFKMIGQDFRNAG